MSISRSALGTAMLLTMACGAMAQGTDDPPRSTTDTVEYCDHLVKRFAAVSPSRPQHPRATFMASEGNRLCHQGHMRPGILRLRRALMLLDDTAKDDE